MTEKMKLKKNYFLGEMVVRNNNKVVPEQFITVKRAAEIFNTKPSNIRYLLDYHSNSIHRYNSCGNQIMKATGKKLYVSFSEMQGYYKKRKLQTEEESASIGVTNHNVSFRDITDAQSGKHVHGLHPYMGKFIPQLAEYYLKRHFKAGDVILDPFSGSGTTAIEANVLEMETISLDIAQFNTMLINAKLAEYSLSLMEFEVRHILDKVARFSYEHWNDKEAKKAFLTEPTIEKLKKRLYFSKVDLYQPFVKEKGVNPSNAKKKGKNNPENFQYLFQTDNAIPKLCGFNEPKSEYLEKWLAPRTNAEANYYASLLDNYTYSDLLRVILSASIRSSRLIKHIDLTRPKAPLKPGQRYICRKHRNRTCKPITQVLKWLRIHSTGKKGAISRINNFQKLRKKTPFHVFHADSTNFNFAKTVKQQLSNFKEGDSQFIDGIFTSPPYVGIIDYHEQHRYAYEIFGLQMLPEKEIGASMLGTSKNAKKNYQELLVKTLRNIKASLKDNADVFIVANDKHKLYSNIFFKSNYEILNTDIRGVYKRADAGGAIANFQEAIFHIKPV